MRFVASHQTRYRYSVPVVLGSHVLRLNPRADHRLESRSLIVWPQPFALREEVDAFGNLVTRADFHAVPTRELAIDSRFELETSSPAAPSQSSLAPLPLLPWPPLPFGDLWPYGAGAAPVEPTVAEFARGVAQSAGYQPLAFLEALCKGIHARSDRHIRPTGDAQRAAETLSTWRGACRDLTVLYLAAVRSLGMAGRFCSGYQAAADTPDGQRYLHAWPEVFVPGVGWRGFDPTHGIAVGDGHVALCAAPEQAGTMPMVGGYSFVGATVTSTLEFSVSITTS